MEPGDHLIARLLLELPQLVRAPRLGVGTDLANAASSRKLPVCEDIPAAKAALMSLG